MRKQITKNVEIIEMLCDKWRTHVIGNKSTGHCVSETTARKRAKIIQEHIDNGLVKI